MKGRIPLLHNYFDMKYESKERDLLDIERDSNNYKTNDYINPNIIKLISQIRGIMLELRIEDTIKTRLLSFFKKESKAEKMKRKFRRIAEKSKASAKKERIKFGGAIAPF